MMYCPTRRVPVACDLADEMIDPRRAAMLRLHRDTHSEADHLPTGCLPAGHPDAARAGVRHGDRASVETVALLEAAAIALGAADLSAESIRAARAADRELRACRQDRGAAVRWARLFHHTLLTACPNRHMLDLIDVESLGSGATAGSFEIGVEELRRVADDHDAILDMIAMGATRGELERTLRRHASSSSLCAMAPDRG